MKAKLPKFIEAARVTHGPMRSDELFGPNGAFFVPYESGVLRVVSSNGEGWDHVSVCRIIDRNKSEHENARCPTWDELQYVRNAFFEDDEWVVSYSPPKANHVNRHPFVLHLWRPQSETMPTPPEWMV